MSKTNGELLATLEKLQRQYPHWRFGQLVANVAAWAGKTQPGAIFDVSDEALLRAAKEHLEQLDRKRSKTPSAEEALAALSRIRNDSAAAGINKLTLKEIEAEIREARRERRSFSSSRRISRIKRA